ncbi:hypothetical protein NGM99_11350 [Mesorhizobium sp. RP14(2022)]|uniref:PAS fold-4 domain-containing protein n=2 Tax=Mesorhizobium liriopis TaxID=2953882 RepID=A0ABT1C6D8_9HYPH|nr:hypothetical protein [Mesorhizobium liriopis]
MVRNEWGQVVDYRLLEANPAHQRTTGLPPETVGKLGSEFMPNVEPYWLELFHRVSNFRHRGARRDVQCANLPMVQRPGFARSWT